MLNPISLEATYVAKIFRSNYFVDFVEGAKGGSAQPGISAGTLSELKCVVPPSYVLKEFYNNVSNGDLLKEKNLYENQTLSKIRDTLLPKLISGEIEVKEVEDEVGKVV